MNLILKGLAKKEKCGRGCRDPRSAVFPSAYLNIGGTPGQEKKRVLIWELDGRRGIAARISGSMVRGREGLRWTEFSAVFPQDDTTRSIALVAMEGIYRGFRRHRFQIKIHESFHQCVTELS